MVEDFRSRMNKLLQEAEELERVAREQQSQLEEMELLVRQRDEQLAEQQARVEELEITLKERDEEREELRSQLAELEEALSKNEKEIEDLRSQLAQREAAEQTLHEELSEREAAEAVLREQLTEAETHLQEKSTEEEEPSTLLKDRFAGMETLFQQQNETLLFIQQELARLHERVDYLGDRVTQVPLPTEDKVVVEPVEEAEVVVEPAEVVEAVVEPVEEAEVVVEPAEVVEAVVEPVEMAEAESPLQIPLYQVLELLPNAAMVGLAGHDGLGVERIGRAGVAFESLEIELADLAAKARSVSGALETGPLLTLAFQFGENFLMLSPVGKEHFAFVLTPVESVDDFRRTQAILLQMSSQLIESL